MAAINSNKSGNGLLPSGFVSPFKLVSMEGTHDDLLACAATLCGKTMVDVRKTAITLGMRANGPFNMTEELFRKIVFNLSPLAVSDYKDITTLAALPDVAVICCDLSKFDGSFRHVIWHHVRGTPQQPAFSYLIDVSKDCEAKHQYTTDMSRISLEPEAWYLEITPRTNPSGTKPK